VKLSSLIVLLITVLSMNTIAQSTPDLILPKESNGFVQWNVSAYSKVNRAGLGYGELAVFVTNTPSENSSIPVQGIFSERTDYLIFTPLYPFENGLTYTVRTKHFDTDEYSYHDFELESNGNQDSAGLLNVFPSADVLPENLLRFYFYFNTPMKKGEALKHICLVDSNGNRDTQAFMQFKEELWSPDGTRLTLLFDPGRIKRGVSSNLELGPALLEGNTFQLVVSEEWQDVYGQKLGTTERKTFKVGAAYRKAIEIRSWNVYEPEAESTQQLTLKLDRIMDHALVQSMIQIKTEENQNVQGNWEISENESVLQFTSVEKWQKGNYEIVFDNGFEDVAGNNLNSLLDQQKTQQHLKSVTDYSIRFEVQ
jgi:hypothetical protein